MTQTQDPSSLPPGSRTPAPPRGVRAPPPLSCTLETWMVGSSDSVRAPRGPVGVGQSHCSWRCGASARACCPPAEGAGGSSNGTAWWPWRTLGGPGESCTELAADCTHQWAERRTRPWALPVWSAGLCVGLGTLGPSVGPQPAWPFEGEREEREAEGLGGGGGGQAGVRPSEASSS